MEDITDEQILARLSELKHVRRSTPDDIVELSDEELMAFSGRRGTDESPKADDDVRVLQAESGVSIVP
jgi:hypothetical protein